MTNFEYYKDEIMEIGLNNLAVANGKMLNCDKLDCPNCEFYTKDHSIDCYKTLTKWLYEEHVDIPVKPTLTEREYMLCKLLTIGYIAKDKSGTLWWYSDEPHKNESCEIWVYSNMSDKGLKLTYYFQDVTFDFIKWEDEKPWNIKDLLQLEITAVGE